MQYDFGTVVDRREAGAEKWEMIRRKDGTFPEGIVPLSVADMEFALAPEIRDGLKKVLDTEVMGYTCMNEAYKAAVCSWMERRHGWKIEKEWICPSNGVVPALGAAVRAFGGENCGVIIMPPIYPPFFGASREKGSHTVECPLINKGGRYEIDFEAFEKAAAVPENKIFLLCSPHNPVGRVWSEEELRKLGDICLKHDLLVVSDEIHFDLIMPGCTHTVFTKAVPELQRRTVVCTAPSKTFNIAGMQTSNIIIADPDMREAFRKELHGGPSFLGFRACEAAYTGAEPWLDECLQVIKKNSDLVDGFLKERLPWAVASPLEGTYLKWVDFTRSGLSKEELEERMVSHGLYLDEGYIFGKEGEGFERINIACPEQVLGGALERLADALGDIQVKE